MRLAMPMPSHRRASAKPARKISRALIAPIITRTRILMAAIVAGLGAATATAPTDWRMGLASWYGNPYHGRITASGEIYDMHALTAAGIRGVELGSELTVCRGERCVDLTVNDRVQARHGRTLDLSYEAARRLGMIEQGVSVVLFRESD